MSGTTKADAAAEVKQDRADAAAEKQATADAAARERAKLTPDVPAMAQAMFEHVHTSANRVRNWATHPEHDAGHEMGKSTWLTLAGIAASTPSVEERQEAEAKAAAEQAKADAAAAKQQAAADKQATAA